MNSTFESLLTASKMEIVAQENHSGTFLSILDDKNKTICTLRQQLENQKLQILYYLKRELSYTKVTELSRSCRVENAENLPIVLALAEFKKQNGMKSNLTLLHEYMEEVDRKLKRNLTCQEFILRKIIEKLFRIVEDKEEESCQSTVNKNLYLDLFNALLEATVGLRKKLDSFRICCNRLILIEDERNGLVEQVINLPQEQRVQCNFLISLKQENIELQNRIKEITEGRNVFKENLSGIQNNIKNTLKEIEDYSTVGDYLTSLKLEANGLFNTSETTKKMLQLKQSEMIANLIKLAGNSEEFHSDNEYQKHLYKIIKKEIGRLQFKWINELRISKTDHERTKSKLNAVLREKHCLKVIRNELHSHLKRMQKTHSIETDLLKQQRDVYKAQVEDLEVIRESYTQLLIKPNKDSSYKEKEMAKTIQLLEKKLSLMNSLVDKQNKEIQLQNDLIEDLKHDKNDMEHKCGNVESSSSKENCEEEVNKKLNRKTNLTLPTSSTNGFHNKKVVKEIIQNVLEDIKSSFSLEIKCNCKENKRNNCCCKELELMKDCSRESIPVFCTPIGKKNETKTTTTTTTTNIRSKNKYSRNIEVLIQNNKLRNSSSEDFSFSAL